EFSGITVGRALLDRKRLPQPVHGALADLADDLAHVLGPDAARGKPPGAVDIGMRHGSAGIGLEGERLTHPARAEAAGEGVVVAGPGVGEAVEQAVHAL